MSLTLRSVIVVVGAGQLGSRYLQGLAKSTSNLSIWVVDPKKEALELAKMRWLEAIDSESTGEITWCQTLDHVPKYIDIAIISTSANVRLSVVEGLCKYACINYWILEKVLAQSSDSVKKIVDLTSGAKGAWVNTPRRLMAWHQQLNSNFMDKEPISVSYGNGMWGMACNSIHLLDLVAWWRSSEVISIDTDKLDQQWIESKRPGFYEVTGSLVAKYSDGSTLKLVSTSDDPETLLEVCTSEGKWVINEAQGIATGPSMQVVEGRLEYQSGMTAALIDKLLDSGQCDLPTLDFSSKMHIALLDVLLLHWNKNSNKSESFVPVT